MFEDLIQKNTERMIIIPVDTKKHILYIYDMKEATEDEIFIKCSGAGISQPYPSSDLALLLTDLPDMIREEQAQNKTAVFQFRVSPRERQQLQKNAKENGYNSVSEFVKHRCLI